MVKRLHLIFDDETFNALKKIKENLGLTWEQLLIEGAKCLEQQRPRQE